MIKTYLYWNINENKESMFIFIEMNHYICFFYKGCPDGTNPDRSNSMFGGRMHL